MSTETTDLAAQFEPALAQVMHTVYRPHFLAKLAAQGFEPASAQEAEELITLGFKLAELGAPVPAEPAPVAQSKFAEALTSLDQLILGSSHLAEERRKVAAIQLAQDPATYTAAMIIQAHEDAQRPAA